jgi:hypothetical protein
MHVNDQQILTVSRELWATQLGLNISLDGSGGGTAPDERTWSSCIKVSGPWQGKILIECSESVVRHAAAVLFAADGEAASTDDIADALKELADMVGKKMRPLLPESSKLSRPAILDELVRTEQTSGLAGLTDVRLNCEGRPVRIALLTGESDPAPAA